MIHPTVRAVGWAAAGAPLALGLALAAPGLWSLGLLWAAGVLALVLVDAALAWRAGAVTWEVAVPPGVALGVPGVATAVARFAGRAPARAQAALACDTRLAPSPAATDAVCADGRAAFSFTLEPLARGPGRVERAWLRWTGPLGLARRQVAHALDLPVPVAADPRPAREAALRLDSRGAPGDKLQPDVGQGAEFEALREFAGGGDRRAIDWKQSARHGALLARETRTERNTPLVLAFDTGRQMVEPLDGQSRLDRAVAAGLALAYAALTTGDRVRVFGFDARPNLSTGFLAGTKAFPALRTLLARLEAGEEDANPTLGLLTLAGGLERRALVVVFTDFTDPTAAELMVSALGRLARRHLVVFATFADAELEPLVRRPPEAASDVSRAVIAAAMLADRRRVLERLRRLGVRVVEAPYPRIGAALLDDYLDVKRRDLV